MAIEVIPPPFTWERRRWELRKHLENSKDIAYFMEWPVVKESLYTGDSPAALDELRQLKDSADWSRWSFVETTPTNGTLIHQAYSLWQWEMFADTKVSELMSIAEFGAGYGEMANLCYQLGFQGEYLIYDFPEVIEIQKVFLGNGKNIVYCDDVAEWDGPSADLFISICSLSEAPVGLRNDILTYSQSHLIRYQDTFYEVDNRQYFDDFSRLLRKHKTFRCEHYTPHWYLLNKE